MASHAKRNEFVEVDCPVCGQSTVRHRSSGWTNEHWIPAEGRSCAARIDEIRAFPEDPIRLEVVDSKPKWSKEYSDRDLFPQGVSGGLPTLGKGRRR